MKLACQTLIFSNRQQWLLRVLNRLLIRLKPRQHKADMRAQVLTTSTYCAACHAQFMDETVNGWGWVKLQDDYIAWLEGPFSGQHEPLFRKP